MPSSESETGAVRLSVRDPQTGFALQKLSKIPVESFDCGDRDLNEWFGKDVEISTSELLTQTYELIHEEFLTQGSPIALVSVCNDALSLKVLEDNMEVPREKRLKSWPAVKLARLAVAKDLQRTNLGTTVINLVKRMFVTDNRTGCRFLTVDAYNRPEVIRFYFRNGFELMVDNDQHESSRAMWFDLKTPEIEEF